MHAFDDMTAMSASGDERGRPREGTDLRSALRRYSGYLLLGGAVLPLLGLIYIRGGNPAGDAIGGVAVVAGIVFVALAFIGMRRARL